LRGPVAAAALGALALSAGCAGEDTKVVRDPRGAIEVKEDEDLLMELRVNASVGYDWRLERPVSGGVLELDDVSVEVDDPEATGSGATKRFRFETRGPGVERVRLLHLYRGEVDERRSVAVTVR
jgi:predicted secreted protein